MSGRDEYRTPPDLFATLDREFHFNVDLASDRENRLAPSLCWGPCRKPLACMCGLCADLCNASIWCNPPYSDPLPWVKRYGELATMGNTVVALLSVDPTTKWWAEMVSTVHELRFTGKRVNFIHAPACDCEACTQGKKPAGNNRGSVICIWRPGLKPVSPVVHWGWGW